MPPAGLMSRKPSRADRAAAVGLHILVARIDREDQVSVSVKRDCAAMLPVFDGL